MLNTILIVISVICGIIILSYGFYVWYKKHKFFKLTGGWKNLYLKSWKGSKEQFLNYYQNSKQYKRSGVYIHKNLTNGKVYVGQSYDIFNRIYREINGQATNKGCLELYQDYLKNNKFKITIIFWRKGYPNLNKMERAYINMFNATVNGYNKTYGNDELTGKTIYK